MIKVGDILVFTGNSETIFYLVIGFNSIFENQIQVSGMEVINLDDSELFNVQLHEFEKWISSYEYSSWKLIST